MLLVQLRLAQMQVRNYQCLMVMCGVPSIAQRNYHCMFCGPAIVLTCVALSAATAYPGYYLDPATGQYKMSAAGAGTTPAATGGRMARFVVLPGVFSPLRTKQLLLEHLFPRTSAPFSFTTFLRTLMTVGFQRRSFFIALCGGVHCSVLFCAQTLMICYCVGMLYRIFSPYGALEKVTVVTVSCSQSVFRKKDEKSSERDTLAEDAPSLSSTTSFGVIVLYRRVARFFANIE